jgi:hypothetical protein
VSEAPLPGSSPFPAFPPAALNERLWHINFNRAATVNERLVQGREDIFFGNGHWVAEEAPDDLLAALTPFLAPYRAGTVEGGVAPQSGR